MMSRVRTYFCHSVVHICWGRSRTDSETLGSSGHRHMSHFLQSPPGTTTHCTVNVHTVTMETRCFGQVITGCGELWEVSDLSVSRTRVLESSGTGSAVRAVETSTTCGSLNRQVSVSVSRLVIRTLGSNQKEDCLPSRWCCRRESSL